LLTAWTQLRAQTSQVTRAEFFDGSVLGDFFGSRCQKIAAVNAKIAAVNANNL